MARVHVPSGPARGARPRPLQCSVWPRLLAASSLAPPQAKAAPLGILLDYAAGVITAADIRAAGAQGAIRYVSDRRPGGAWMLGKPIQLPEARDLYQNGLKIVSCYQYGKQDTADWLGGQNAGVLHAKRGWQLHVAAGGSYGAPIYASIDDDPTYEQYKGASSALSARLGSGSRPSAGGRLRQLQDDRLGASGRPRLLLLAAQLGLAARASPIRPPTCTRSRSTSATSAASAWTSTTFSSRGSVNGTKTYRSVSSASKLFLLAGASDKTKFVEVVASEPAELAPTMRRNFYITI